MLKPPPPPGSNFDAQDLGKFTDQELLHSYNFNEVERRQRSRPKPAPLSQETEVGLELAMMLEELSIPYDERDKVYEPIWGWASRSVQACNKAGIDFTKKETPSEEDSRIRRSKCPRHSTAWKGNIRVLQKNVKSRKPFWNR